MHSATATLSLLCALIAHPGLALAQDAQRGPALAAAAPNGRAAVTVEAVATPGASVPAARASTEVLAPLSVVGAVATDFARYHEFLPQVRQSRLVRRRRGQVDVYLQVPLLDNLGVLWALTRFTVRRGPAGLLVDGHTVEGNVERFDCRIELAPGATPGRTRATLQILGLPRLPLPESLVASQQLRWGRQALGAFRDRAERLATARRLRSSLGGGPIRR